MMDPYYTNTEPTSNISGSLALYRKVRGAFSANGTSFNQWCMENGICRQYAAKCLKGQRNGIKSAALRQRISVESTNIRLNNE